MKIVRFSVKGEVKYGVLEGDTIKCLKGEVYSLLSGGGNDKFSRDTYQLSDVKLLAPCEPSKLVCIGLNYRGHAQEVNAPLPEEPIIFLKPPTAVIGPDAEIILPRVSRKVDYEGELGVVIGKRAKDVPEDRALEYVLGYMCVNDVSERYYQKLDGQWTRAKGFDTFAPIGPWIVTGISGDDLKLETYLNGEVRQSSRTSDLIFGISALVSFVSVVMTLLPGDVISTGTPSGIGQINAGDVVEVRIENIGTLRNPVVAQS